LSWTVSIVGALSKGDISFPVIVLISVSTTGF